MNHGLASLQHDLAYHSWVFRDIEAAVICTNTDLNIVAWNPGAARIYGYTEAEAIGREVDELLQTRFLSATRKEAQAELAGMGKWQGLIGQVDASGKKHFIRASVSFLRNDQDSIIGGVTVNHDITAEYLMDGYLALGEENRGVQNLQDRIAALVMPYLNKLRLHVPSPAGQNLIDSLVETLNALASTDLPETIRKCGFTPSEEQVALLITKGYTSKEIAAKLSISTHAISFHRRNIRKKCGIAGDSISLYSYLRRA